MHKAVLTAAIAVLIIATGCAAQPSAQIEIVAELDQQPGNIAVTPTGRIIFSQHPFGAPDLSVVELQDDGSTKPFPTEAWSRAPEDGSPIGLHTVIGIESDRRGTLWILDLGSESHPPKLVAWDTNTDALHRVIHIPAPAAVPNSFMQDLAIDPAHNAIYIADMGRADLTGDSVPAIVVVDLDTGISRRVLHAHPVLQPEADADFFIEGTTPRINAQDGPTPNLGLNPITIDAACQHVYFGAMNGTKIFRIPIAALLDESLSDDQVAAQVETVGPKPPSDGISIDADGNVYITDVNNNAIGVLTAAGEYSIHAQDDRMSWPDGISFGPDGYGYATVNQLHRHALLNAGNASNEPPYYIVRFRPRADTIVGR